MGEAAKVWVAFGLHAENFNKGMKGIEKSIKGFEKQMKSVNYISKSMNNVGTALTKRVTLPIIAAGAAAMVAFGQMDEGYDAIRLKSGATGKALEDLNLALKQTVGLVPNAIGDTAEAMAILYAKTGQTGTNLEALTVQMMNLIRLTEQDTSLVPVITSMFGRWQIATTQQSEALDWLWKAAQATGTEVDRLSVLATEQGNALKQMGFGYRESIALLGQMEAQGVNVESVLAGMKTGLAKMAKQGIPVASDALKALIRQIRVAGSAGQANAIAIEAFGAKAGTELAAAIREGRFDVETLVDRLNTSGESINKAAGDTDDWAESFAKLKNRLIAVTEPLGGKLNNLLIALTREPDGPLIKIVNWIGNLIDKFVAMPASTQNFVLAMIGAAAVLGPLLKGLSDVLRTVGLIETAFLRLAKLKLPKALADAAGAAGAGGGAAGGGAAGGGLAGGAAAGGLVTAATAAGVVAAAGAVMAAIAYAGPLIDEGQRKGLAGPINEHATGGIITRPIWGMDSSGTRHLFGEKGDEAVVPLNGRGLTMNHTGTITVRGVNSRGDLVAVMPLVAADIRADSARYATTPSARRLT